MNWDRMERATLNKGGREGIFCNTKTNVKVMVTERMTVTPKLRISLLSLRTLALSQEVSLPLQVPSLPSSNH